MKNFLKWAFTCWYYWVLVVLIFFITFDVELFQSSLPYPKSAFIGTIVGDILTSLFIVSIFYFFKKDKPNIYKSQSTQ